MAENNEYSLSYKGYVGYFSVNADNRRITIQISTGTHIVEETTGSDAYNAIGIFEKCVDALILKEEAKESYLKATREALRSLIKIRKEYYKENNEEAEINF